MKKNSTYFFIIILVLYSSCELAQLEEPSELSDNEMQLPTSLPVSEEEFGDLFHGNSIKTWVAMSFSVGSLELQDCRLDDNIIINSEGTYEYDGGSDLCGAEDNRQNKSGTWSINESLSKITFTDGATSYSADLAALVSDTLVVHGNYLGLTVEGVYVTN